METIFLNKKQKQYSKVFVGIYSASGVSFPLLFVGDKVIQVINRWYGLRLFYQ